MMQTFATTDALPTSRAQAKREGSKRYFTGNECPSGHIAPRYVSSGNCVECITVRYFANHEQSKTRRNEWRKSNSARINKTKRSKPRPASAAKNEYEWRRTHPEHV